MTVQLSDEELDRDRLSRDRIEVVGQLDIVESELQSEERKLALSAHHGRRNGQGCADFRSAP